MAKKGSSDILGILAFIAVMLSAVLALICLINKLGWFTIGGRAVNILYMVAYICLVVVVIFVGWNFASSLSIAWRVIYIIIAVLAFIGFVGLI